MTWACFSRKCICFQHHFRKSKWLFVGSDWVCLGYLEHHFVSLNFVLGMPFCKWGTCDPIFHSYIFGTQLLPLYTIEDTFHVVSLQFHLVVHLKSTNFGRLSHWLWGFFTTCLWLYKYDSTTGICFWVATGDCLRFKKELKGEPIVEIMAAPSEQIARAAQVSMEIPRQILSSGAPRIRPKARFSQARRGRLRPVWRDEAW